MVDNRNHAKIAYEAAEESLRLLVLIQSEDPFDVLQQESRFNELETLLLTISDSGIRGGIFFISNYTLLEAAKSVYCNPNPCEVERKSRFLKETLSNIKQRTKDILEVYW